MTHSERSKVDRDLLYFFELDSPAWVRAWRGCGDADLDDFIKSDVLRLRGENVVRTYVAAHSLQPVGFVALLSDAMVLTQAERKKIRLASTDHPVIPALKIARLGVDERFRRQVSGVGTELVRFAFITATELSDSVGCRLLTLDAYPESLGFYERLGFGRSRAKGNNEKKRPSMWLDLFATSTPSWL